MADKQSGISRRAVAASFLAALPLAAAQAPAPAPDSIEAARDSQKRLSEQMRKLKVPIETEPAFTFHP